MSEGFLSRSLLARLGRLLDACLNRSFLAHDDLGHQGPQLGEGAALTSGGESPGMLLPVLQHPGQRPPRRVLQRQMSLVQMEKLYLETHQLDLGFALGFYIRLHRAL